MDGRDEGYWDNEFDPGVSATWVFEGEEGLRRLEGPSRWWSPAPAAFAARVVRVQLDHVALEAFSATAHWSERGAEQIERFPTPMLTFLAMTAGRLLVELPEATFTVAAGGCVVLDSRDPVRMTAEADVRILRSVIGVEHLPEVLEGRGATLARPLRRTALVESFVAAASSILRSSAAGRPATGEHLIAAIADLQSAVLAEAQDQTDYPSGPAGLRYRVEAYIESHYRDPSLTPVSIAERFHISVRQVHAAFADGERTVSQCIRDCRVNWVARQLRGGPAPRLHDLAEISGFGSRDVLTRAFHQRFGMSPTDYRNGGYRHFAG